MATNALWFILLLIIAIAFAWWFLSNRSMDAKPPEADKPKPLVKDSAPAQPLMATPAAKVETPVVPEAKVAVPQPTPAKPAEVKPAKVAVEPASATKPKVATPPKAKAAAEAPTKSAPAKDKKPADKAPSRTAAAPKTAAKPKAKTAPAPAPEPAPKPAKTPAPKAAPKAEAKPAAKPKAEAPAPKAAPKAAPPKPASLTAIGIPGATGAADNLLLLKGVGPKLNTLLGTLEISRFDQIAAWGKAEIAKVDEHLGAFKGRIERDAWIEQAGLLAKGKIADFEAKFGKLDSENR